MKLLSRATSPLQLFFILFKFFRELVGGVYRVKLWLQKFASFFGIMLLSYVSRFLVKLPWKTHVLNSIAHKITKTNLKEKLRETFVTTKASIEFKIVFLGQTTGDLLLVKEGWLYLKLILWFTILTTTFCKFDYIWDIYVHVTNLYFNSFSYSYVILLVC